MKKILDNDLDKIISVLELKTREIKLEKGKRFYDIRLSLLEDFYKENIPILTNEEQLGDCLLRLPERTNGRFLGKIGYSRKFLYAEVVARYDKKDNGMGFSDIENYDLIYEVTFDKEVKSIFSNKETQKYYITKNNDSFCFNGTKLELTETARYFKIFSVLYSEAPTGGDIKFSVLIKKCKEKIFSLRKKDDKYIQKYILDNLTGNTNGFGRKSGIPMPLNSGKNIIENIRGTGIRFNNEK